MAWVVEGEGNIFIHCRWDDSTASCYKRKNCTTRRSLPTRNVPCFVEKRSRINCASVCFDSFPTSGKFFFLFAVVVSLSSSAYLTKSGSWIKVLRGKRLETDFSIKNKKISNPITRFAATHVLKVKKEMQRKTLLWIINWIPDISDISQ